MWKALKEWLKPDLMVAQINDIPIALIAQWGARGVILDVDNTLLARKSN